MIQRPWVISLLGLVVACGAAPSAPPVARTSVPEAVPEPEAAPSDPVVLAPSGGPQPSSKEVPIEADDIVIGSPLAPVTLVEFTDLQCPFCARWRTTFAELRRKYRPEQLRVVVKHNPLPFHPLAKEASHFAQAVRDLAGSEAALAFVERAFREQKLLGRDAYRDWLADLGLDVAEVEAAADSVEVHAAVVRDMDLAQDTGATGTPNFFVNGVKISGAQPFDKFKTEIDAQLEQAKELARAGTPAAEVYGRLVARNFARPGLALDSAPKAPEPPDLTVWKVPITGAAARGAKQPLVTITAFYDYQCPFSKRVQPTIEELLSRYPDEVRLVVRHNPLAFHTRGRPAANLAIEARVQRGDAAFFEATKRLFESQQDLSDEVLLGIARDLKLNQPRAKAAIAKGRHDRVIDADMELASDFQARGVPHFFVNGVRLSGAQPLEKFVEAVDRERQKALALTAGGVSRAKLYTEITKNGREPEAPEHKVVPIPADSPSRGPAGAAIVIQVFSDFQCPFCKRVEGTIAELDRKYPGQIRWVWRNLPLAFHQQAKPAARAALEARAQHGDRAFWRMHDELFAAQGTPDGLGEQGLLEIAQRMGLDLKRFQAALDGTAHDAAIDRDVAAAQVAKISGTPGFLVNGYYLSGAQPIAAFERLIRYAKAHKKPAKPAP